MIMNNKCEDCVWWKSSGELNKGFGKCHFMPPAIHTGFPITADDEFCSKFQPHASQEAKADPKLISYVEKV